MNDNQKEQARKRKENWDALYEDFHRIISSAVFWKYGKVCYSISYDETNDLVGILIYDKPCQEVPTNTVVNQKFKYPILNTDAVTKGEIANQLEQIIYGNK